MPSWLDTPDGAAAWADDADFDCLEPDDAFDDADEPDDADSYGADSHDAGSYDGGDFDGDDSDDWEPPPRRLLMLPPAAIGLIAVGVIACLIAGYSLLRQNEPVAPLVAFDEPGQSASAPASASPPGEATQTAAGEQIVVSVVGLVHKPGLVRMDGTARVADAIAQAGGARQGADLLSLNMAQRLRDGDQILVGRGGNGAVKSAVVGAAGSPPAAGGGSEPSSGTGLVDLNAATAEQLDALPGVGPVTAAAIIAWREANGRFASVEQLANVDGIGPARLARLKPLVTVG